MVTKSPHRLIYASSRCNVQLRRGASALSISEGRIQLTKWTFLGLRVHHQEIRIDRVASVKYTKGVIWGGLLVETFGGATEDISQGGFDQVLARDTASELKEIIAA